MKYSVQKSTSSGFETLQTTEDKAFAFVKFHDACKTLWNTAGVNADVAVLDTNFNIVEGKHEHIYHEVVEQSE